MTILHFIGMDLWFLKIFNINLNNLTHKSLFCIKWIYEYIKVHDKISIILDNQSEFKKINHPF